MTKAGSGDDKPDFTAIEAKVKEAMQRLQVPGVAIGVISGEHEFAGGYGITNIENAVGVDTSTLFQIGSNTKTMTATVLMRLVEQDKISLDAPVRQYLPDFKLKDEAVAASVTVRELFTHRAGWLGDFFEDTGDGDDALAKYVAKMVDIPQRAPRDLLWSYNNAAFNLAGRLIEVVTGKTYEAAVKELLFEPLGMNESLFFPREIMTRKFATGHAPGENGLEIARLWPLPRSVNAAGGVSASLNDMLRYAKFHLGDGTASDGTRLLSADSLAYLQTPLAEAGSIADQMGLSWMLRDVEGVRIVQHGGGTNGHISALMLAPAKKFALVILTNSQRGGELNGELSKWLLQEYLGIEEPVPDGIVLPKESLAGYVGRYTTNYATIEVALNDGGLTIQMITTAMLLAEKSRPIPPPSPLLKIRFFKHDTAILTDGALNGQRVEFLRDADGSIGWLRLGARAFRREPSPQDHSATFQSLSKQVREIMREKGVPGAALGVVYKGQEYTAAWGVTSVDIPLPVTTDTLFQIGSTTKTLTATAAIRLAEMGKLDLDAPVRRYLADFKLADEDVASKVTVRQLFNHTGGWLGDYFEDTGDGDDALQKYVAKMADLPQLTPLGEIWSYNNAAFCLAGRIIEAVTGQSYEAALTDLVLTPLGMKHSFSMPAEVMTYRYVVGHNRTAEGLAVARPWAIPRSSNPAGGVASSVKDQLIYAKFHLGDGTGANGARVLSKAALTEMQTPTVDAGTIADGMGLSWFVRELPGARLIQHGGTTNGQLSAFVLAPDHDFGITVLTNSDQGGELHHDAVKLALKLFLNVEEPTPPAMEKSADERAEYAGRYVGPYNELHVADDADGLVVTLKMLKSPLAEEGAPLPPAPPPIKVAFYENDKVVATEGPFADMKADFLRDADGKIAFFRFGARAYPRR